MSQGSFCLGLVDSVVMEAAITMDEGFRLEKRDTMKDEQDREIRGFEKRKQRR